MRRDSRIVAGWLGSEALGNERLGRGLGSFFLDLSEQPGFGRRAGPVSLRMMMSETAGLENYGARLGHAAATSVVEVHKRYRRGIFNAVFRAYATSLPAST